MAHMNNPAGLSPIVAGTSRLAEWAWSARQRLDWIEGNVALGVTSFDHADIYGAYSVEALFGEALALAPGLRSRIQIVSKCGIRLATPLQAGAAVNHYDTSPAHVRAVVDRSLAALRTDHLDLLLIHRPDALLDVDELSDCLQGLQRSGKVRHVGVSNFSPSQLAPLHRRIPLATHQIELSVLRMEPLHDGSLDQCVDLGLRPMVWSPLSGGRIFTAQDERAQRVRAELQALAQELGVSPTTVAIAWVLRHPSQPIPILGSRRIEVARDAMAARSLRLQPSQWYRLWTASAGRSVP